ncbi:hypothetical protein [Catellatospora citrea]|uniref:Uncharacterized protein n=1 Tax=Catellatospora citrea TaxID=53366 RepID=A0A8J3KJ67_9ACTN|nr:hypothetical protein [Catellatospora citrea]RKE12351.1 hypothetical protein C8E86_7292 [Catellatospora citrea]GIG00862.1 hypothetical protein Cci01nite_59550 [Catellatospora citrea]
MSIAAERRPAWADEDTQEWDAVDRMARDIAIVNVLHGFTETAIPAWQAVPTGVLRTISFGLRALP